MAQPINLSDEGAALFGNSFFNMGPCRMPGGRHDGSRHPSGISTASQLARLGYNYSHPITYRHQVHLLQGGFCPGASLGTSRVGAGKYHLIVHPSWLDAAIQTGLAACSFPRDMRL